MKKITIFLVLVIFFQSLTVTQAQVSLTETVFDEIKILVPKGEEIIERSVKIRLKNDVVQIETSKGETLKTFQNSEIKNAEYSYSKNPRWKTGLGLGAASLVFPPLLLVAIPLGFTKHRRHWVTIRTEKDFAVLKISKSARKVFIPAFETQTGVKIEGVGESK